MRNGRHFVKKKGKEWQSFFNEYLNTKYKKELIQFRNGLQYPIIIEAEIYHYHLNYFVKDEKRLNSQCIDSDACLKIIQDQYCKILGIDDKLVKQTIIRKARAIKQDAIVLILHKKKDNCFDNILSVF